MTVNPFPVFSEPAPNRNDKASFSSRAQIFVNEMTAFVPAANESISQMESLAAALVAGNIPPLPGEGGNLVSVSLDESDVAFVSGRKGHRNALINGQFFSWPEGTSFSDNGNIATDYFLDGWRIAGQGSTAAAARTIERLPFDETVEPHPIPGKPAYKMRISSDCRTVRLRQKIEKVSTFAGQKVTASIWCGAGLVGALSGRIDQYFGTGGTASALVSSNGGSVSIAAGGAFQRCDFVIDMPDIVGKTLDGDDDFIELVLSFVADDGAPAVYDLEFAEASIVQGDATNEMVPGAWATDGDEFYRCRELFINHTTDEIIFSSDVTSGLNYYLWVPFQRRMRAVPDVSVTTPGANRFTTDPPSILLTTVDGFYVQKSASATGFGWFQINYTADARL